MAHTFCATGALGHVSVALYLTVAQELAYVPNSFASPSSGRLARRCRDRRVHTNDTRLVGPQHLAGTQRLADGEQHGAARQHQSATDQLGDASEPDDESGCVGTEPERRLIQQRHDGRRDRLDEGEDTLTSHA